MDAERKMSQNQNNKQRKQKYISPEIEQQSQDITIQTGVHSLAVSFMKTVRAGISDQTTIVEGIIEAVGNLLNNKGKSQCLFKDKGVVDPRHILGELQAAVQDLRKVSECLQQKLFDLDQSLIVDHLAALENQRTTLIKNFESQIEQVKVNHLFEVRKLQAKVQFYHLRCLELQKQLATQPEHNPEEYLLQRKLDLSKYLEAIEDLAQELQFLKNTQRPSLYQTEASYQYQRSSATIPIHEVANENEAIRRSKQHQFIERSQKNHQNTEQSQICSLLQDYYPQKQSYKPERANRFDNNRAEVRSAYIRVSESKAYLPRDRQVAQVICPPTQRLYIYNEPSLNRPVEVPKYNLQQSDKNPRKLSVQKSPYHIPRGIPKPIPVKDDKYGVCMAQRIADVRVRGKMQQRDIRLQSVQQKLYGLKRKLSRQLRNMRV